MVQVNAGKHVVTYAQLEAKWKNKPNAPDWILFAYPAPGATSVFGMKLPMRFMIDDSLNVFQLNWSYSRKTVVLQKKVMVQKTEWVDA